MGLASPVDTASIKHLSGKLEACFDDVMLKVMVFAGLAAALLGVIYGWYRLLGVVRDTSLPTWRKATSSLGLVAATAQALIDTDLYGG